MVYTICFVFNLLLGLPWYCYTYRQTHCRPLFHLPADWRPSTDRPATTTVVKIKKRPKDGNNRQNVGPNDLPIESSEEGEPQDGQNQQFTGGQNQGK
jgi:hypothetical protein